MFGFTVSSINSSLIASRYDPEQERAAPALPREIFLPRHRSVQLQAASWTAESHPDVARSFSNVRKPSDIGEEHLKTLNLSWTQVEKIEQICNSPSIPPVEWLGPPQPASTPSTHSPRLSDGRTAPQHRDFHGRIKEFQVPNSTAYSVLSRKAQGGAPAPRLSHSRRFWEALDESAYYWDTTQDHYIPPRGELDGSHEASPPGSTVGAEDSSTEATAQASDIHPQKKQKPSPVTPSPSATQSPFPPLTALNSNASTPSGPSSGTTSHQAVAARGLPRGTMYTGYRISSPTEVPMNALPALIRGFMEPIAWAHGLSVTTPRRAPVVKLGSVLWPVRLTHGIYRPDTDRVRARAGWIKGPIIGVRCADAGESWFGKQIIPKELEGLVEELQKDQDQTDGLSSKEEILELVRDFGVLLLLAQERAREKDWEGKRPGEGMWWTTTPRWGGGPGGEMGEGLSDEEIKNGATEAGAGAANNEKSSSDAKAAEKQKKSQSAAERRKLAALEAWKTLRPSQPYWDIKTVYEAIGKPDEKDWDEVYLLSAVHSHISILRLRVHRAYVAFLTSGQFPNPVPEDPDWCRPTLKRTQWFDMFNMVERIEAVRATWGVLSWLTRSREDSDVEMKGT